MKSYLSLALAALLGCASNAFVPKSSVTSSSSSNSNLAPSTFRIATDLNVDATGWDSFRDMGDMTNVPGGEAQRQFRRTVYTHDDWKKHRSQDRFIYYLAAIFNSGVYKNLGREVGAVTAVATFLVIYNALVGGYTDFEGVKHAAVLQLPLLGDLPKLTLPLAAFTVTSPSLGLLLVFRTNTSYQRWDEARKNWGMNINHTRDLARMANCYYDSRGISPEQRADDLNHVALCTWAFVRAMKRHLSPEEEDEAAFREELYEKLPPQQAEMIIAAAHRPNRALQDLSSSIEDLPMHFMRKNEIHKAATIFEDNLGSSERILTSPVPLFYTRHLARFLAIWLLLLPLGMYDSFSSSWNNVGLIPAIAVVSTMLFGIEEIGTQLEEPFTVLPMQAFCDKIYNWCMEIMSWAPGDNGRGLKPAKVEHVFFTDKPNAAPADGPPVYDYQSPPPVAAAVAPAAPVAAAPVAPVAVAAPAAPVPVAAAAAVAAPAATNGAPQKGAGGMFDTRDPEPVKHEDPRKSISAAPSFEEYLKQREGKA